MTRRAGNTDSPCLSFYPPCAATLLAPREFERHTNPQLRRNFRLTVKRKLAVFSGVGSRRENVSLLKHLPALASPLLFSGPARRVAHRSVRRETCWPSEEPRRH